MGFLSEYKYLNIKYHDYALFNQVLRSGTSIGANTKEGVQGQSKSDFVAKLSISLKEASETEYWLELLRDSEYITTKEAESLLTDCVELIKLLTAILKKARTTP